MEIRQHIRESFKLAYPVMLTNLGHVAMGVTDNLMVGNVNAVSLAAAGLALVIFNVIMLFGIGVSYAITPLVASAHGSSNKREVTETVRHGLVINIINSLILIIAVLAARNLLFRIGQPEEVVLQSLPFLSIITFSLIPIMVFQTFKQFAEGLSYTRVAMMVMIGANVVNIMLNYMLVYGKMGFPALGLEGSGWATLISRSFMAVTIVMYVYYDRMFQAYRAVFTFGNYSRTLFRKMLNLGIPSGGQFIFEVAAFDFSLVMMGWLGTLTQAAHQITINMATVSYMTTAGLAAAATVRIGFYYGSADAQNLRKAAYTILAMAMGIMALWAVIFIVGRSALPGLYVNEAEVIPIASSLMVIAGLFQLSDGAQVVCASALRGFQDVKIPSLLIFIAYWIIGLPLGYYFTYVLDIGPTGIWWGLLIGLTVTALALFMRLRHLINRFERSVNTKAHFTNEST